MLDLSHKTIVITGANTGLGQSAALQLAASGARLLLCCRDLAKAQSVQQAVAQAGGDAECLQLDLADLESVRRCAQQVSERCASVDILINNAGLAGAKGVTRQGFELTFGVNHLGHFLLTQLLLPKLLQSTLRRVINLSSTAHYKCPGIDFDALTQPTRSGSGFAEYRISKLANILHAKELVRRFRSRGLRAAASHPGVVRSDIWRNVPQPFRSLIKLLMTSNERGAATTVQLATCADADFASGGYYHEGALRVPSTLAEDPALAAQLWRRSCEWTAVTESI